MNNVKRFEGFLFPKKDGILGRTVDLAFHYMKKELKYNGNCKNKLTSGHSTGEAGDKFYKYRMNGGDEISVSIGGGEFNNPPQIYFNNKNVTNHVDKEKIIKIYNFLEDKYNNVCRNPIEAIKRVRNGETIKALESKSNVKRFDEFVND